MTKNSLIALERYRHAQESDRRVAAVLNPIRMVVGAFRNDLLTAKSPGAGKEQPKSQPTNVVSLSQFKMNQEVRFCWAVSPLANEVVDSIDGANGVHGVRKLRSIQYEKIEEYIHTGNRDSSSDRRN